MFDVEAFGMIPAEAINTDPQQRLLLMRSWEALTYATQSITELVGREIGTFVGISTSEYRNITSQAGFQVGPFSFTSAASSQASGRIAFSFGLRGPSASIDTACSSSLVAAHQATQSFKESKIQGALVAGVMLALIPETFTALSRANLLSLNGRCLTFDASADGYARGESCRALYLQVLVGMEQRRCASFGALLGSAVNTNGRALSLTAPNGPAQQMLLRLALSSAKMSPEHVNAIHTHANGTPLGDPIEIGATLTVLRPAQALLPLVFSTVKGYSGHQEAGAGAVGLIEGLTLSNLQALAPALHLRSLNPHVSNALQGKPAAFARGGPFGVPVLQGMDTANAVGISSFGANGTNAHVIVRHAPPDICISNLPSELNWKTKSYWALSAHQALIETGKARIYTANRPSSLLLQSNIATQRSMFLWDYSIRGLPHLAISTCVAMMSAAMTISLGNGVTGAVNGDELHALLNMVSVAPVPLASWSEIEQDQSLGIVLVGVEPSSGRVEVNHGGVQAAMASYGLMISTRRNRDDVTVDSRKSRLALLMRRQLQVMSLSVFDSWYGLRRPTLTSQTIALREKADGHSIHPTQLEAFLPQQAFMIIKRKYAASWVRSIRTMVASSWKAPSRDGLISTDFFPLGLDSYGSVVFSTDGKKDLLAAEPSVFLLSGVHISEHNLPKYRPQKSWFELDPVAAVKFAFEIEDDECLTSQKRNAHHGEQGTLADTLSRLPKAEIIHRLQRIVASEVRNLFGRNMPPTEPLMTLGLDSRGAMELRQLLGTATGLTLPVTLLYDYQTVNDIATYLAGLITLPTLEVDKMDQQQNTAPPIAAFTLPGFKKGEHEFEKEQQRGEANRELEGKENGGTEELIRDQKQVNNAQVEALRHVGSTSVGPEESQDEKSAITAIDEDFYESVLPADFDPRLWRAEDPPDPYEERDRPTALLTTIRPPQQDRPLFLAAPGVNSAQAAYFSFVSKYMGVSWFHTFFESTIFRCVRN